MRKVFRLIHRCLLIGIVSMYVFTGSSSLFAQLAQPARFETEVKYSDRNYSIVSMHKEGLALIHDNEKYEDGKKIWELTLLDTALNSSWSGTMKLNARLQFIGYEYLPGNVYLLFRNGETNANDLHLIHHRVSTHETSTYEIKHQVDFRITHFSMAGNNAVFGGYIVREPAVFLYSTLENQTKVVPGFFLHDTELLDLRVNHNNTFNVLMTERGSKEQKKLIVRTYDENGTMLMDDIISVDRDVNLIAGMTSSLLKDEMIVIGTYGIGTSRQATGLFSVMVDPFSEQTIRYTDLTQFNHLIDYVGTKRVPKIKQSAHEQRLKGKSSSFRSNVALVRIQELPKGFLLLAEVYNSSTGSSNLNYWGSPYGYGNGYSPYGPYGGFNNRYYNTPYSFNNNNPIHNTEVKMLESAVILFDDTGKPDWDESIDLDDIKYPALEQVSDFIDNGKGITLAYKKDSEVFSKRAFIHDSNSEMDTTKIKLKNETDVVRNEAEGDGGMRQWYTNYFYTWGYQSIKDPARKAEDPNRYVFYINKLRPE